jgi:predicted glycoside hydrolase/deacetylase ChbG (UPF0249 family)
MANGAAAGQALHDAHSVPGLGIGLHLNIVRGRPLSDPADIPSIVDGKGRFYNSPWVLFRRSSLGLLRDEDIYTEYRRQVQQMLMMGITPTHLDSEKHTHILIPGCRRAVKKICDEFNVRKVRSIRERKLHILLAGAGCEMSSPRFSQYLKLVCLENASSKSLRTWQDICTPDLFFGFLAGDRLIPVESLNALRTLLSLDVPSTVEWMFHLGYDVDLNKYLSDEFGRYFLDGARIKETEFLMSGEVMSEIGSHRDQMISYGDI